jgi:hypothetical protein
MEHVAWARDLAERLLAKSLPRRWAHSQGVGRKAESIAHIVGDGAEVLVCSAWLHDIGYAPSLTRTGFHSLDGARHLRDVEHADDRLCSLVAYHSCALIEAKHRQMSETLTAEFQEPQPHLADVLTYSDMTTDPDGLPVRAVDRIDEILLRYNPEDLVHHAIVEARPHILAIESRIRERLDHDGLRRPEAIATGPQAKQRPERP